MTPGGRLLSHFARVAQQSPDIGKILRGGWGEAYQGHRRFRSIRQCNVVHHQIAQVAPAKSYPSLSFASSFGD